MKALVSRSELGRLLTMAAGRAEVYVPVRDDGGGRFVRWDRDESALQLTGEAPRRPPKEVLFAQTETLFTFGLARGDFAIDDSPPAPPPPRVLFGVRPCDGRAFEILDTLLLKPDHREPAYDAARSRAVLVGIGCSEPGPDCFCRSVGGDPHSTDGLDVAITDLGDELLCAAVSARGREWLGDLALLDDTPLAAAGETAAERAREVQERARQTVPRAIDVAAVRASLEGAFESDLWDDLAPSCIGCGTCTYLCPTCRCFDIQDEVRRDRGRRLRVWDSCMYGEYTQEASGHNPRPRQAERFRNKVYDKFAWSGDGHGNPACVGCGRCISHCPAGIDLVDLAARIAADGTDRRSS